MIDLYGGNRAVQRLQGATSQPLHFEFPKRCKRERKCRGAGFRGAAKGFEGSTISSCVPSLLSHQVQVKAHLLLRGPLETNS